MLPARVKRSPPGVLTTKKAPSSLSATSSGRSVDSKRPGPRAVDTLLTVLNRCAREAGSAAPARANSSAKRAWSARNPGVEALAILLAATSSASVRPAAPEAADQIPVVMLRHAASRMPVARPAKQAAGASTRRSGDTTRVKQMARLRPLNIVDVRIVWIAKMAGFLRIVSLQQDGE